MKKFIIFFSLSLNLISVFIFLFIFDIGNDKWELKGFVENKDVQSIKDIAGKFCDNAKLENVVDAISYASQLGRLDIVSLILAILGLILGFGAIAGFLYIKEGSKLAAKQAAEDWLSEKGQVTIYEYLNKNPDIIEKAINQRMDVELGKPKNLNDEESKELSDIKWEPESE